MSNLYYIRNVGCDDETCGLAEITDVSFPYFKEIIENLNKNSTYGCMPTIEVYKVLDRTILRLWDVEDDNDWQRLYLNDKIYAIDLKYTEDYRGYTGLERVI